MSEDKCEVCDGPVYSVTCRRFGDHILCRDCGDGSVGEKIRKGIESVVSNIIKVERIQMQRSTLTEVERSEMSKDALDYFMPHDPN